MNNIKVISFNKYSNKIGITSIGYNLQFDLVLSLNQEQYTKYNINYKNVKELEDIKAQFTPNLISLITLTSNESLFNSALFINRANYIKNNIRYIIPYICTFYPKYSFVENIIDKILKKEGINLIQLNLTCGKPKIRFIMDLVENNRIIYSKNFVLCDEKSNEDNNFINDDNARVLSLLNKLSNSKYIITSSSNFSLLSQIFESQQNFEFILKSLDSYKVCVIFDGQISPKYLEDCLISTTDVYFFEKDEMTYYNPFNHIRYNERKKLRLEVIIDKLNVVSIIQYDSISNIAVFKFSESTNIFGYSEKEYFYNSGYKYYYSYLKSVYIGSFLSRLLYNKTFYTCLKSSSISVKKVLKLKNHKVNSYKKINYKVLIKRNLNISNSIKGIKRYKLESQFILDGNNSEANNFKEYNSLYDSNCMSFWSLLNTRKYLYRRGFINKKGKIMDDPDKFKASNSVGRNNKTISFYKNHMKKIYENKEKSMFIQRFFGKLSNEKDYSVNTLKSFNILGCEKLNRHSFNKGHQLPSLFHVKNDTRFYKSLYYKDRDIKRIEKIATENRKKRFFKIINTPTIKKIILKNKVIQIQKKNL